MIPTRFIGITFLLFILAATAPTKALAITDNDLEVFRSPELAFSQHYPKDWSQVKSTYKNTAFKIVSDYGGGGEDFMVNVQPRPDNTHITPKLFQNTVAKDISNQIFDNYKRLFPDAELIKSGPTYISNQEAIYFIYTGTHKVLDIQVNMTHYFIVTSYKNHIYLVGGRCKSELFQDKKSIFDLLISGFQIYRY